MTRGSGAAEALTRQPQVAGSQPPQWSSTVTMGVPDADAVLQRALMIACRLARKEPLPTPGRCRDSVSAPRAAGRAG
jgi:hypothetical protein